MTDTLDKQLEKDPDWRGISITGIEKQESGEFKIKGYDFFSLDSPGGGPLHFIAVDQATGKEYRERIRDEDPHPKVPPPREPKPSPKELEGMSSGGPFEYNLSIQLPVPTGATYEVRIEFAGHTSNSVIWKP